jgi:hypothetical protein
MRLCLCVMLALMAVGGIECPNLRDAAAGADALAGFDPPKLILDLTEDDGPFPAFADIDGDGKIDLVLGVADWTKNRGGGRLRVYRNQGTKTRPAYAKPTWLDETVPTARIPDG